MIGTRRSPRVFIYFDEEGVQSLYAQVVEILETERIRKTDSRKSGRVGTKIGIGRLVSALLGGSDTNVNIEMQRLKGVSEEIKMKITMEQRLTALIHYLEQLLGSEYFTDLMKALLYCRDTRQGVYINVFARVNAPQFYLYDDPVSEINSVGAMSFEIVPPEYDYSDKYFKRPKDYRIIMQASLTKFPRLREPMLSQTGHEAVFFRSYKGRNIPLNIFGYLFPLGNTGFLFQIKPFAMWL